MLLERPTAHDPSSVVGLSPALRELGGPAASAVAARLQRVELSPDESVFPEDDRIDALYIVDTGQLHATETDVTGNVRLIRTLGPGELVDQLQVLSGGARPVRVRAAEPTGLWMIPGELVDALVESQPEFRLVRERTH